MVDREDKYDDNIQHGIDDSPRGDAEKGAALGGLGGAVTGGIAGSAIGPVGTVVGAVVGGVVGAAASGVAVAAVDKVDNDNNMTGVGDGVQTDVENTFDRDRADVDTSTAASGISTDYAGTNWEASRDIDDNTAVYGSNVSALNNEMNMPDNTNMADDSRGVSMHADYTRDMADNIADPDTRANQDFPENMANAEDYSSQQGEYGNNTPNYSMGMGGEQPGTGFGQRNAAMGNDMGVTGEFGTNSNDLTTGQASTSNDMDVANNMGETQAGMTNYGNVTGENNDLDADNWNNENNIDSEQNRKF